ncbi:MAG: hypothetical protein F2675_01625, partial [Actinobacteria bacterium]|nr:hypothetical protein [Actinomycetota bacterium]
MRLALTGSAHRTWRTALLGVIAALLTITAVAQPAAARDLDQVRQQVFDLEAKAESS